MAAEKSVAILFTVTINKDWPQGKLVADMFEKRFPLKHILLDQQTVPWLSSEISMIRTL